MAVPRVSRVVAGAAARRGAACVGGDPRAAASSTSAASRGAPARGGLLAPGAGPAGRLGGRAYRAVGSPVYGRGRARRLPPVYFFPHRTQSPLV